MKIVILSLDKKLYSTMRLVEAAKTRGHEVDVVDTLKCYLDVASQRPGVHYKGRLLPQYDAVIPRIGASITEYGTAVLRQFEMIGTYPLNESVAITRARDKLRSLQILARAGIGLPLTGFASSPDDTQDLIGLVGGAPLVLKLTHSSQGRGVVLAETQSAAESLIGAFRELQANFLVQEYIREAGGTDIRCFVIGDRVVAAMMRVARAGEFRSNLHRGGTAKPVKLTPEERATAVLAAKKTGLNVSGVDIVRSNRGPVVLEVNASPGLEGIEGTTGVDIAGLMIEFIEKNAKHQRTRTRGKG